MYYNKEKVESDLEDGISDAAETIEDLASFINSMINRAKNSGVENIFGDFITEWEGE